MKRIYVIDDLVCIRYGFDLMGYERRVDSVEKAIEELRGIDYMHGDESLRRLLESIEPGDPWENIGGYCCGQMAVRVEEEESDRT